MQSLSSSTEIVGTVIHGRQLGRRLGYPTANLDVEPSSDTQLPLAGVFAAWSTLEDGTVYPSMVNIGFRPTVDTSCKDLSVEAHLIGFDGDLYGQTLRLSLVERIRDERQMQSLQQLRDQLTLDLEQTKAVLV